MKPQETDRTLAVPKKELEASTALVAPATRGKTIVADSVIATIARITAEQIEGVHQVGESGLKGVWQRLGSGGVDAEVGMKEAAVSLDIIIEYGYRIRDVTAQMRTQVLEAVQTMASRKVIAVDINVVGIHVAKSEPAPSHNLA